MLLRLLMAPGPLGGPAPPAPLDWEPAATDIAAYIHTAQPGPAKPRAVGECTLVVCTVPGAHALGGWGLAGGHFSHIMLDDAAALTEPECCIALALAGEATESPSPPSWRLCHGSSPASHQLPCPEPFGMAGRGSKVVLAGDPTPQGPPCSPLASGLHCSLLERLSTLPAYTDLAPSNAAQRPPPGHAMPCCAMP